MSTSLILITNSELTGKETTKDWEKILRELKALQMDTTTYVNANNERIKESGDWEIHIDADILLDGLNPFRIDFIGPFHIMPSFYTQVGVIYTIYRYSLLYDIYALGWLESFRRDLYNIVTLMGGTEVIYLADNCCDKLGGYLELMVEENMPYATIKNEMMKELGPPVTDYAQLDPEKLDYRNINEFFLDDFYDLKNQNTY